MTATINDNVVPLVNRIWEVLKTEQDAVKCQQAMELVIVRWSALMGGSKADFVADSIHKHIKQIMKQWREYSDESGSASPWHSDRQ